MFDDFASAIPVILLVIAFTVAAAVFPAATLWLLVGLVVVILIGVILSGGGPGNWY